MPVFSTLYLQSSDFSEGEEMTLTISGFEKKVFTRDDGTERPKWILSFEGLEATLPLNDVNGRTICQLLGKEMSAWIGKRIILHVASGIQYNGAPTRGIRVKLKASSRGGVGASVPTHNIFHRKLNPRLFH